MTGAATDTLRTAETLARPESLNGKLRPMPALWTRRLPTRSATW